jgi:hypothetical protein
VALKGMYSSTNDENEEEEEDESLEECTTSTSCISPLETSYRDEKNDNTTASNQANSVAPVPELGGTGFCSDQHHTTSLSVQSTPQQPNEVISASSQSPSSTNDSMCHIANLNKKKENKKEKFNFDLDKMTNKDKKNVLELIKRVRRQEDELTRQQAYRDSFEEELKKLKKSNDVLSRKCKEDITEAYACATNSLSCAASLEKEIKLSRTNLRNHLQVCESTRNSHRT